MDIQLPPQRTTTATDHCCFARTSPHGWITALNTWLRPLLQYVRVHPDTPWCTCPFFRWGREHYCGGSQRSCTNDDMSSHLWKSNANVDTARISVGSNLPGSQRRLYIYIYMRTKLEATSKTPLSTILLSMLTQPAVAQAAKARWVPVRKVDKW